MRGGLSAIGKLLALVVVVFVFFAGMAGVVYLSLQGSEIKVPEITGKNFIESEHQLASLGLKIKKRADRVSTDPPNTVLEQLPKPGETVKTGQMILVVTSKAPAEGETVPSTLKKGEEDDTEKIEEMISEKPKKPKANTNTNRKKADTTRDVEGSNTNSTSDSNTDSPGSDSNKKEPGSSNNSSEKSNKSTTTPSGKPGGASNTAKPSSDTRPKPPNRP